MSLQGDIADIQIVGRASDPQEIQELFNTRTRISARWDSDSRNSVSTFPWFILNLPHLTRTRVATRCVWCERRIGIKEERYYFTTPWSKIRRQTYFNLHQACYYALIILSIEKLRQELPSNMH